MKPSKLFAIANPLAAIGWVILIVQLFIDRDGSTQEMLWYCILGIILLFCILYVYLVVTGLGAFKEGGFGSLAKVMVLFRSERATLAGWVHFLAFDLITGSLIIWLGFFYDIHTYLLIPCLVLTFLFGPAGFLLFAVCMFFSIHATSLFQ